METYKTHFIEKESDITIISELKSAILRAKSTFYFHRNNLERYIEKNNNFLTSFSPVKVKSSSKIINLMAEVAFICDVGPMASVAGALADLMLVSMKNRESAKDDDYIPANIALVENGGEISIDSIKPMKVGLFAGFNELNLNIGFLIEKKNCPLGIGTSSATIGHAISLGKADAVTIFAENAALADAAATKIGNIVKGNDIEASIKKGLDAVDDIYGVSGALISRENKVGQSGKLPKLIKIEGNKKNIFKEKLGTIFPGNYEIFR
ncbi:MAG: UPF0280 family protein [Promethearchaeota archaeon]